MHLARFYQIINQKMSLAMTIVSSRFGPTETIPRPIPVTSATVSYTHLTLPTIA